MIRAVLDTNTLISAFFWDGVPGRVYTSADDRYILLTSELLLEELKTVLERPKFTEALRKSGRSVSQLMAFHTLICEKVESVDIADNVIRDPKDRIVLGCALGGQADYVVSGDKDLLILERYANIPIISAVRFLEIMESDSV